MRRYLVCVLTGVVVCLCVYMRLKYSPVALRAELMFLISFATVFLGGQCLFYIIFYSLIFHPTNINYGFIVYNLSVGYVFISDIII